MDVGNGRCQGCYWQESCEYQTACSDYTPIDSEDSDIDFYNNILRENIEEYESLIAEQNN